MFSKKFSVILFAGLALIAAAFASIQVVLSKFQREAITSPSSIAPPPTDPIYTYLYWSLLFAAVGGVLTMAGFIGVVESWLGRGNGS